MNKVLGRKKLHPVTRLVQAGILKHGTNCELTNMEIFMADEEGAADNIIIGDNCCIRGVFVLYKNTSKIVLGNNVYIGPGTCLECVEEIKFGNDILVSRDCNIIDTNSHSLHSAERVHDTIDWQKGLKYKKWEQVLTKKVSIEDKCWMGLRTIVMKGVTLKEGTIVASGSVVAKSTEAYTIVGGNPAVKIREAD